MVESTAAAGDGITRDYQYAKFRTDKEATPGYSGELVSNRLKPEFYDDLDAVPKAREGIDTLL